MCVFRIIVKWCTFYKNHCGVGNGLDDCVSRGRHVVRRLFNKPRQEMNVSCILGLTVHIQRNS